MNPYVYSRRREVLEAVKKSEPARPAGKFSALALAQAVISAAISPATAFAVVLFAASSVFGMAMIAKSEMSSGDFAPLARFVPHKNSTQVLGVATYNYTSITSTSGPGSWVEGWIESMPKNNLTAPGSLILSGWAYSNGANLSVSMVLKDLDNNEEYNPDSVTFGAFRSDVLSYLAAKVGSPPTFQSGTFYASFSKLPAGHYQIQNARYNGNLFNLHNQIGQPIYINSQPSYGYTTPGDLSRGNVEGWLETSQANNAIEGWAYDNGRDVNVTINLQDIYDSTKTLTLTTRPYLYREDVASHLASRFGINKPTNSTGFRADLSTVSRPGVYRITSATFNGNNFGVIPYQVSDKIAVGIDHKLHVTSPNGGESWPLGSTQSIKWTDVNAQNSAPQHYTLFLTYQNGSAVGIIADLTDVHEYAWKVGDLAQNSTGTRVGGGNNYYIQIVKQGVDGIGTNDQSDGAFSIGNSGTNNILITTSDSLNATQGQYYKATFSASGGVSSYYTITTSSDSVDGLSFTQSYCPAAVGQACSQIVSGSTITLYGTPTQAGTFNFSIKASDGAGNVNYQNFILNVSGVAQQGNIISVQAYGSPLNGIYPTMQLTLGGNVLGTWTVNASAQSYSINTTLDLTAANLRVYFTNDAYAPPQDRNLEVDSIIVNGKVYLSDDPLVYSTGVWDPAAGCAGGYKTTKWLSCNGYFEYPTKSGGGTTAGFSISGSPPAGFVGQLYQTSFSVGGQFNSLHGMKMTGSGAPPGLQFTADNGCNGVTYPYACDPVLAQALLLSGTPSASGSFPIIVTATDLQTNQSASQTFTIVISQSSTTSPLLTVGLNPAVASPITFSPGTVNQKIASFQIISSPVSGANITSLTLGATRNTIGSNFQNLKIMVNGIQVGPVQAVFASNNNYTFTLTNPLVIPAGGSATIDCYIDVTVFSGNSGVENQNLVSLLALSGSWSVNNAAINAIVGIAGQTVASSSGGNVTDPTITVTGPVGGESWQVGQSYTIKWNYNGPALTGAQTLISLQSVDGNVRREAYRLTSGATTSNGVNQFSWTVPAGLLGSYRVSVGINQYMNFPSRGGFAQPYGEAGSNIVLVDGTNSALLTPNLTVLSPNNERLVPGQVYTIKWHYDGPSALNRPTIVSLRNSSGAFVVISTSSTTSNGDNTYQWTVPSGYSGNWYVNVESVFVNPNNGGSFLNLNAKGQLSF